MRSSVLVRLGRDSEIKQVGQNGTSAAFLACAYNVGYGDKKTTTWIDIAVFGKQAEALSKYFVKGNQFLIHTKDIQLEEFTKNDQTQGTKLKGVAESLEFTGKVEDYKTIGSQQQSAPQAPQQQSYQQHPPQTPQYQQPNMMPPAPQNNYNH